MGEGGQGGVSVGGWWWVWSVARGVRGGLGECGKNRAPTVTLTVTREAAQACACVVTTTLKRREVHGTLKSRLDQFQRPSLALHVLLALLVLLVLFVLTGLPPPADPPTPGAEPSYGRETELSVELSLKEGLPKF